MRRLALFLLLLAALALTLSACAPLVEEAPQESQIYATFYPFYALTSLLTEDIEGLRLSCLVQPQDGCLRDYALSDWDLYLLAGADLVIAGGRGLESFESTLQSLGASRPRRGADALQYRAVRSGRESGGRRRGRPLHRREPAPVHGHRRREVHPRRRCQRAFRTLSAARGGGLLQHAGGRGTPGRVGDADALRRRRRSKAGASSS